MTTQQTERELFEQHSDNRGLDHHEKPIAWEAWQAARAPLLTTIAQQGEALEAVNLFHDKLKEWCEKWATKPVFQSGDNAGDMGWYHCAKEVKAMLESAALISQKVEG